MPENPSTPPDMVKPLVEIDDRSPGELPVSVINQSGQQVGEKKIHFNPHPISATSESIVEALSDPERIIKVVEVGPDGKPVRDITIPINTDELAV